MSRFFSKFSKATFVISIVFTLAQATGCGIGGGDAPFVFGDGSDGGNGSESPTPTGGGTGGGSGGTGGTSGETTGETTGATTGGTPTPCEESGCPDGQVCNTSTHQCGLPSGACEVDFNATLALKIDAVKSSSGGHFDSPPACCEYADVDGGSTCPTIPAGNLDSFLKSPSENTDLYCCSSDSGAEVGGTSPQLFCDTENRHGGLPELAVTRWPASAGAKVRMKFLVSDDGTSCVASLVRDQFPEFKLENTALDASLIINAGEDYRTLPPNPSADLNAAEITSPCTVTTDGSGNVQVAIDGLPLRFLAKIYSNFTQCMSGSTNPGPVVPAECPAGPFADFFFELPSGDPDENSIQVIPGTNNPALTLTTGSRSQDAVDLTKQSGAMSITGSPMTFDTGTSKTNMTLVAAFGFPNDVAAGIPRNDQTGGGQLLAELSDALLTAELKGTVTRTNGQPIQTLADLTTNCGDGGSTTGGGTGGNHLELTMRTTFDAVNDDLVVTGDVNDATSAFTAEACIPGKHDGGVCKFSDIALLPFAKDTSAGDPAAGTEAKFVKEGTLVVTSAAASSANVTLQVPSKVGAFTIVNAASLQNITLSSGNSATLQIRFEPETAASGCVTASGVTTCQANLTLSSSHSISVTLKGQAKAPAAEVKLQEIGTIAPNDATATLLPSATAQTVAFGETLLGIQTKTKLYKISNSGVRPLTLNGLQAADVKQNFRLGSVYQGADFASRTWKVGQNPWTIAPNGSSDFFFFLNYGPFGKVNAEGTREDAASLVINTTAGVFNVGLTGSAKKDSRATVALYVEDPSRFTVTGASDPDLKDVDDGGTTRHLYLAKNKLFSFRQDSAPRAVYLFNAGTGAGLDDLVVQHLKFNADAGGKIVFAPDAGADVTACLAALPDASAPCATLSASGNNKVKLGTMTFTPSGSSYAVSEGSLDVKAISKPAGGGDGVAPIIGGMPTNVNDSTLVNFGLKGASGAPDGTFDLKVHRLIAGFSNKINQGLQKTLIVSGSTKGILKRFNDGAGPDVSLDGLKENFKIEDGMILDPVTGAATLKRIVTAVDADPNNPLSPASLSGLRLYNAPGSQPANTEYFAECSTAGTHNCAFFYLYIGDWAGSTASASCNGGTKFPVIPSYAGTQAERDALFASVMRPDNGAEFSCLGGGDGMKDETGGTFDPVTGEITFRDLAVRLFAPEVPALSNKNVDATIRLSLTTQCVNDALVPDTAAKGQALVPNNTLSDSSFNTTLMPTNPLLPYVDQTGSVCGVARTLHGRGMFQDDTTGTLDNDSDPDALNFDGFDLAGVGRNVTSQTSVSPANMYIIIKAEVGEF